MSKIEDEKDGFGAKKYILDDSKFNQDMGERNIYQSSWSGSFENSQK